MIVVGYELVCYETGLLGLWSVMKVCFMNVVCYEGDNCECGLF